MESFVRPKKTRFCWLKALPVGLLLLLQGHSAMATMDTFDVGSGDPAGNVQPLVNYTTPIWATNFLNGENSQFVFDLAYSSSWIDALYSGWHNTVNYTNYGEMDSYTGFRFDTLGSVHTPARSFYNSGVINCGSLSGSVFLNQYSTGSGVSYGGYGGVLVLATNIFNSGNIAVGSGGLAKFTGERLDFSNGSVSLGSSRSGSASFGITATGQADTSTNSWSPATTLGPLSAYGWLNTLPRKFSVNNSVPYFDILKSDNTGTNVTVRMVFLEDYSVNVATNVYFTPGTDGSAHVEWVGTYTDPATGDVSSRYLYLDNNYSGLDTNILSYGDPGSGVPGNFTFSTTTVQRGLTNPATSRFVSGLFSTDNITNNIYSYVDAQMLPTTVSTTTSYGTISVTNLPGRVEFSAAKALNLSSASISGMNYLLLNSPNQFDYGQSQLASPYLDAYLGNTNGSMVVTNLIQSAIPRWSGTVQAWSTRWTNSYAGTNYDYRVLIVSSQLSPASSSQMQDFVLYSSNNVVISDVLNISRRFSLNCTNLLLTYNDVGNGAASPMGELNLMNLTNYWATSVPRLSCLTNYGYIETMNATVFGSPSSPYLALVNGGSGSIYNYGNTIINARNFENSGIFYSYGDSGSFSLQSLTATMSYGEIYGYGEIYAPYGSVSATAADMVIEGTMIEAGKSLKLTATNLLTDNAAGDFFGFNNYWTLGNYYSGFSTGTGLVLPIKPKHGDLLGTTIEIAVASATKLNNTWAGENRGYSVTGYADNTAIGWLMLDARITGASLNFSGTGTNNAIYVDCLQLLDFAGYTNRTGTNIPTLTFNKNLVIYYAQARDDNGVSIAEKINHFNSDHLRWLPGYAGTFSSTSYVYPDGETYVVNAALAASTELDSDLDGNPNSTDPTPVLVPSQVKFNLTLTTNHPPLAKLAWQTIPLAGNYVYYKTNLLSPNWLPFTNFNNYYYGLGTAVTNAAHTNYFVSPQPYVYASPADNWEVTNVWVLDTLTNVPHFYRVMVQPN
jgi:hypothetical protein